MGHGTPDWWGSEPSETIHQVQDVGELAARLGSIDIFDRSGNVIWLTSFEDGIAGFGGDGEGSEGSGIQLSAKKPHLGAYHLDNYTGAGNTGNACNKTLPYPESAKIGVEGAISYPEQLTRWVWRLDTYDGTNYTRYAIRYTPATTTLEVQTGAAAWTTLAADVRLLAELGWYNQVKLVVDMETGKYVRCLVNDRDFGLSDYSGVVAGSAIAPRLMLQYIGTFSPAGAYSTYLDDVIITQNEV